MYMARMGQEKLFELPQVRGDVGAEAAHPESRALETDASGLNGIALYADRLVPDVRRADGLQ